MLTLTIELLTFFLPENQNYDRKKLIFLQVSLLLCEKWVCKPSPRNNQHINAEHINFNEAIDWSYWRGEWDREGDLITPIDSSRFISHRVLK